MLGKNFSRQHCEIIFLFFISVSPIKIVSIKHFSGTTAPRILKFGANFVYDLLYCGKVNWPAPAYSSIYLFSFFLSNQNFGHLHQRFCVRVFKWLGYQGLLMDWRWPGLYM